MINRRKLLFFLFVFFAALALGGCRTRTTAVPVYGMLPGGSGINGSENTGNPTDSGDNNGIVNSESISAADIDSPDNQESDRRLFDSKANAEIQADASGTIDTEGGEGAFPLDGSNTTEHTDARADNNAALISKMTVITDSADRMTASDEGSTETAFTFYSVLLNERVSSLFECKKLNVYIEKNTDYITVFKTSVEHSILQQAGAYDVSARLLEENLSVNPGWISRKSPDAAVKFINHSALNASAPALYKSFAGREEFGNARRFVLLSEELTRTPSGRVAAALAVACALYPDVFSDIELGDAVFALLSESGEVAPGERYFYFD